MFRDGTMHLVEDALVGTNEVRKMLTGGDLCDDWSKRMGAQRRCHHERCKRIGRDQMIGIDG
jgi:hypothetical protein